MTAALTSLGVLLALLLLSAAWAGRKPGWQVVFGPPEESRNRIALTEFYAEARQQGWDFAGDQQLFLDLAIGLREAALAGAIETWGRKCRTPVIARAPDGAPVRIPADFWKHHDIDGLSMAVGGMETNNFLIRTRALPTRDPAFEDATYQDLHLNYMQAMNWLQTDADAYKGISRRGILSS